MRIAEHRSAQCAFDRYADPKLTVPFNVVYGGKTPDLDLREAEGMGYKLAIVPGLLIKFVVGICEQKLAELKALHRHPEPPNEMKVREVFRRVGADEWDARRTQFRTGATIRSAAE